MIIGLGSDLCNLDRIAKTVDRFGDRFLNRIFTKGEQAKAEKRSGNRKAMIATLARRFAAKEACSKALGTGLRRGVFWRDMEVVNLPSGQPSMKLTGGAAKQLLALTPEGKTPVIHVSLTDDPPFAQAIVMISI